MRRRQILIGGGVLALAGSAAAYAGLQRMGSMEDYDASVAAMRAPLSQSPTAQDLIRFVTLAPNGHNTQPWRFHVATDKINILPDFSRRTPAVDPDDHHLFVSQGCAAETLAIAARTRGHAGDIGFNPTGDGAVSFVFGGEPKPEPALLEAIRHRQSTRADYDGREVGAADLRALHEAGSVPGIDLVLVVDRAQVGRVSDLVLAGKAIQMSDPAFMRELKTWLRFNPREAIEAGDGLFTASSGHPTLPTWLGRGLFDRIVTAASENADYARQMRSSTGVAVFVSERDDKDHRVRAGRACQRFALQATALGLKLAFVNQPVEVAGLRPELASLVRMPGRRPDIVMRFGYGPTLPFSARRPVARVLSATAEVRRTAV